MTVTLTGNPHVDGIAQIHFEGNITPPSWCHHIRYTNKRGSYTDHLAILLLADIVYWYRPSEIRDESSGMTKTWKQKFQGDAFNRTYERYAVMMGCTMTQVVKSMHLLQDLGLIEIEARKITMPNGRVANNVTHFIPVVDAITKITYTVGAEVLSKKIKKNYHAASYKQSKSTPTDEFDCSPPTDEMMCRSTDEFDCTNTESLKYGDYLKQKQEYEHELLHRAHSSHGGDRALFFNQSSEEGYSHGDKQMADSCDRGSEQTAVVHNPVGDAEVITLPPTPVAPPPSPAEKFSSVRVEKKARAAKIKFTVNHLGWLQLPKGDRYAFARWLAVRRLKYQLALSFTNVKIANDSNGNTKTKGNQICFKWGKESWLENEMFEGDRDGNPFDLSKLRDTLDDRCMVTQEEFNDFLEYAFMDALKWLDENGVEGRRRFKYNSPAFTFLNSDNQVFAGIKKKYRG